MILPFSTEKHRALIFPAILFLWAVLLRLPTFGNPILDFDEDWYLYAGGQFLQGYLPYIDVWDRKPFGLFLLYAPFALLGKYRFLAYQLGALAFAWGTALFILKMAQKFTSLWAGCLGGMLYLALIMPLSGFGGQSPVFYNLLVAWAFYLIISRFDEIKANPHILAVTGMQTMLLFGIAIEIKPSVVFEGIFLGCFLLFTTWVNQKNLKALFLNTIAWVFLALLPTFAVMALYLALGHFQDWYFANVYSIFLRHAEFWTDRTFLVAGLFVAFLFTLSVIITTERRQFTPEKCKYFNFVLLWASIAFLGVCLSPPYFSHYLLSFALPFGLLASFAVSSKKLGTFILAISIIATAVAGEKIFFHLYSLHPEKEYYEIQKIVAARPNACLFEYGASVTMLDLTPYTLNHCHLTKYAFPSHLGSGDDTGSLGVDEIAELQNILDQQPSFILVGRKFFGDFPFNQKRTPLLLDQKNIMVFKTLQQHYRLVYKHVPDEHLELYERNETTPQSQ